MLRLVSAVLLFLALPLAAAWHQYDGEAMGTRIHVELWHEQPQVAQAAIAAVMAEMVRIDQPEHEHEVQALRWAAQLHEIGISIAHSGFHKHGAYIIAFADMPGFSRKDQERLSLLLLAQRGKFEKLPPLTVADALWRSIIVLRLATLLHRSRDDQDLPVFFLRQSRSGFELELAAEWLGANPLSAATLNDEVTAWQRSGVAFRIKRRSVARAVRAADTALS